MAEIAEHFAPCSNHHSLGIIDQGDGQDGAFGQTAVHLTIEQFDLGFLPYGIADRRQINIAGGLGTPA